MSGVAGGDRIQKQYVDKTFQDYQDKVLSKIPGFKSVGLSGSVKARKKTDYGDLDLIVHFEGDDKREVKKDIIKVINSMPDNLIIPFKSEKHSGKKYYNAGELISVLFPISGMDGSVQIDNIIALSEIEQSYKTNFLDLPAEKQGLLLGLAKVIILEDSAEKVFKRLGIRNVPQLGKNQEYEFNLSSSKLSLRLVTLEDFKEVNRKVLWETTDWGMVEKLFEDYDLDVTFEELFNQVKRNIKNKRSFKRIAGVFRSMVNVSSGEIGTAKGTTKQKALDKVQTLIPEKMIKEEKEKPLGIALFPGAFKPPTKGHFNAVKQLATNSFKEATWEPDEKGGITPGTLAGRKASAEIKEVRVIISRKDRNGISAEQSKKIWDLYNRFLPNNVKITVSPDPTPIKTAYDMVTEEPDELFFFVSPLRDETDFKDLSRLSGLNKFDNARALILKSEDEGIRATELRKALLTNSYEEFKEFIPDKISEKEAQGIFNTLKDSVVQEAKLFEEIGRYFDNLFENTNEASSGTHIQAKSVLSAVDRASLVDAFKKVSEVLDTENYDVKFNSDHIRINIKKEGDAYDFDYTPYMKSILEYMMNEGKKITPLPEIRLKNDINEAANFFGRTAYYDPSNNDLVLFVAGRHPKDVMRSFVHEMVHHMQNLDNRIGALNGTNVNEDSNLLELEKEAYLEGNILFRSWEDKVKNSAINEDDDPCWDGYEMVGMKEKDGKQVPNCVPKKK